MQSSRVLGYSTYHILLTSLHILFIHFETPLDIRFRHQNFTYPQLWHMAELSGYYPPPYLSWTKFINATTTADFSNRPASFHDFTSTCIRCTRLDKTDRRDKEKKKRSLIDIDMSSRSKTQLSIRLPSHRDTVRVRFYSIEADIGEPPCARVRLVTTSDSV